MHLTNVSVTPCADTQAAPTDFAAEANVIHMKWGRQIGFDGHGIFRCES